MALVLSDEQTQLRDSARSFLAAEAPVSHLRALRDTNDPSGFSHLLWEKCAEMGFSGILVDEAHGGLGLDIGEAAVIAEELGRTLAPVPYLSTSVVGASILRHAPRDMQEKWLPRIAQGRVVTALALDERARHRPDAIGTTARSDGQSYVLDGRKVFVVDGHVADLLIVAAMGTDGLMLFGIDPLTLGVVIERTHMVDSHNAARISLSSARVPGQSLICSGSAAETALAAALDLARTCIAAELLGAGEEVFNRTLTYLSDRLQFDRKIGEFQALQHRAAHLFCELELARAAVMRAVEVLISSADAKTAALAVSVAKAKACGAGNSAVQEAVQMHGGNGMTDALDIGFFMKRVRVLQELLGDASFHEHRFAQLSGY